MSQPARELLLLVSGTLPVGELAQLLQLQPRGLSPRVWLRQEALLLLQRQALPVVRPL
ncbi:hypothetical protein PSTAB_0145 [Stutzerimonas stutzeri]|uniref:Uncharacterized protein n=1 Tax=Stutzerimonas stutzeri (strain ATCC 17588 / DSM 5190 / CCUG 11256 / JCM 5965 / LMG 11199 / NBRC 14165 / NCIMB 11358 / Stanier 221) TaxID=96563 RepID=F8H498_STUS2|nr:hypothetical protein PSTAB_0145 [Stutzerimonas stutzeri]